MTEKTNILEVYYEPSFSGITRHVGQIVEYLKGDSGLDFHILCSTNDPRIPEYYRNLGVFVESVPGAKYFTFRGMWKVFRIVRKHKISRFIFTTFNPFSGQTYPGFSFQASNFTLHPISSISKTR